MTVLDKMPVGRLGYPEKRHKAAGLYPMALFAPHERQARANHGGQSLQRLAERGGLDWCEAVAILRDRRWERMDKEDAVREFLALAATPDGTGREASDG